MNWHSLSKCSRLTQTQDVRYLAVSFGDFSVTLPVMPRSDAEIWVDVLFGSAPAWKELIKRYQSLVNTVAVRSGLSMADAADCFQTTWMRLYENRYRIQDSSKLAAWLVTTAKREAIRLRRIQDKIDPSEELLNSIPSESAPDKEYENIQKQAALENGLAGLATVAVSCCTPYFSLI